MSKEQSEGQVSEVGRLDPDEADTPVQASDSTGGKDDAESGADTVGTGPDAVPPENRRDNDMKPHKHHFGESIGDL